MKKYLNGIVLLAAAGSAGAGNHVYAPYPEAYVRECASCHVAYPPELLTQAGWKQVMNQLDRHFGVDASLDRKTTDELAAFLAGRASTRDKNAPAEATARLTRTAWFMREHRGAAGAKTTFSDCAACHRDAASGDFSERGLRATTNRSGKEPRS